MMRRWNGRRARGRKPPTNPRGMNRTEAAYAELLEARRVAGSVLFWEYEPAGWKLTHKTRTAYHPDFLVLLDDMTMEWHEVKAGKNDGKMLCEDDAKVKMKVFADKYPFFRLVVAIKLPNRFGGGWRFETVGGGDE